MDHLKHKHISMDYFRFDIKIAFFKKITLLKEFRSSLFLEIQVAAIGKKDWDYGPASSAATFYTANKLLLRVV